MSEMCYRMSRLLRETVDNPMTDQAAARRMRLLEALQSGGGRGLADFAADFQVDERTIRRDIDYLQDLVMSIDQIVLRRSRVHATREARGPGYFADQIGHKREAKEAIARRV